MAEVSIDGDQLVVEIEGLDKLWALRSRLVIPLANIRGASDDPDEAGWKGLRVIGSHVPGVITAGTFRVDGEWVFWDVRDQDKAIVIELADERYARLVIEVPDPAVAVALIHRAISV